MLSGAAAARRPGGVVPGAGDDAIVLMEGVGTHLGMRSRWRLAFADGAAEGAVALAFVDEVALVTEGAPGASAAPLEARSGFDPTLEAGGGGAWAESLGGGVTRREWPGADGEHRATLAAWARTGQWLDPSARRRLNVKLLRVGIPLRVLVDEHSMALEEVPPEAAEPVAGGRAGLKPRRGRKGRRKRGRRGAFPVSGDGDGSDVSSVSPAPEPPGVPEGEGALLALAARGGKIGARVWLRRVGSSAADDVSSFRRAFERALRGDVDARDASSKKGFERALEREWWVVHRAELALPEGAETWVFDAYAVDERAGVAHPRVAHRTLPGGDRCEFRADAATRFPAERTERASDEASGFASFDAPPEGYRGVFDARWPRVEKGTVDEADDAASKDAAVLGFVPAGRGGGGHVLLRPSVNGVAAPGWFAIDTSSCGNAIDPTYADALGMPAFGRLAVVGAAAASLAGALRRGEEVAVGGCALPSPLFMEQALAGAMRCPALSGAEAREGADTDGGGRLLGTLGTDFLQHCVLEIRAPKRAPGAAKPAAFEVLAHDPATFAADVPPRVAVAWQRVTWISGAPHVRARVLVADDALSPEPPAERARSPAEPRPAAPPDDAASSITEDGRLFRLALGSGGTGAIVARRAAEEWRMVERTVGLQPGGVLSAAGEDRARFARVDDAVVTGRLARLEFGGAAFENVRALTHLGGDPPDLGFSPHVDGALCADLFRGCDVVLDLGNDRIAVVQRDR